MTAVPSNLSRLHFIESVSQICANGEYRILPFQSAKSMSYLPSEHPVEAGEVYAWFGYQGDQPGDEIQGLKQDVGGAIAVGCFELVAQLAVLGFRFFNLWFHRAQWARLFSQRSK